MVNWWGGVEGDGGRGYFMALSVAKLYSVKRADKAARDFTAFIASAYRMSTRFLLDL
jgi:hypothetical protein